jgi:hypothetical protein
VRRASMGSQRGRDVGRAAGRERAAGCFDLGAGIPASRPAFPLAARFGALNSRPNLRSCPNALT